VRGVQEEFQFRNLSGDPSRGLAIDGVFGPKTEEAVRGFRQGSNRPCMLTSPRRRSTVLSGP
jgi:peptidoglycan hydrolase-like protein with peptidoglycan-binding domain